MQLHLVVSGLLTLGLCAASSAGEIEDVMSCLSPPQPTALLEGLASAGRLGPRWGPGVDDEYCWMLAPALDWHGQSFRAICAVTDEPGDLAAKPDLYWQDAAPPFTEVWLVSSAARADLAAWAKTHLPRSSRYEIDPPDLTSSPVLLACSEWRFPLPD